MANAYVHHLAVEASKLDPPDPAAIKFLGNIYLSEEKMTALKVLPANLTDEQALEELEAEVPDQAGSAEDAEAFADEVAIDLINTEP